ncbi:MAG: histidine phosphatase family protein [Leptolyngbya sp. RL_3_1]|nr:histidine phosphatase family protein [Leptolyngbya sp. RL_3_1]
MRLLFIRHGESTGNVAGRIAGHSDDGLSLPGWLQSTQLARWLQDQPWQPSHIYISPLRRARETLQALAEPWDWGLSTGDGTGLTSAPLPPCTGQTAQEATPALTISADLAEFQAGILTGLTWAEAEIRYSQLCESLMASSDWLPIPEAETPQAGRDRAQRFIQHLLHQHQQTEAIWVISHQWILQHLIASLLGCDRTWQIPIPNTGLFEFELDRDRWHQSGMAPWTSDLWQIKRFGDCPHLPRS